MGNESPPPGWFLDPFGQATWRYWDGVGWTGYVRSAASNAHLRRAKAGVIAAGAAGALLFGAFLNAVDPGPGEGDGSSEDAFIVLLLVFLAVAVFAIVEFGVGWSQYKAARRNDEALANRALAPAGWYRDPENPDRARYWTGSSWSDPVNRPSDER